MTHRHFVALAKFLRLHIEHFNPLQISLIADFLSTQHPRFNRDKFMTYVCIRPRTTENAQQQHAHKK